MVIRKASNRSLIVLQLFSNRSPIVLRFLELEDNWRVIGGESKVIGDQSETIGGELETSFGRYTPVTYDNRLNSLSKLGVSMPFPIAS